MKQTLCAIEGCDKKVRTRGWCSAHYWRWHRHGDPLAGRNPPGTGEAWVRELLKEEDDGQCRDWPFSCPGTGYASLGQGKLTGWRVLELSGRPKPLAPNNYMLHSCDRPVCVAPWHLSWGSQVDNMRGAAERGRMRIGSTNGYAKLTEEDVVKIRELYLDGKTQKEIGNMFGVEQTNIGHIVRRKTWKHV